MTPGEAIREAIQKKGWTQTDLAHVLGKPLAALNEVIQGKRRITPEMALGLAAALGTTAEFWMNLDVAYWLSRAEPSGDEVARRARIYELAPIKDIQRRGWIKAANDIDELESEMKRFFGVQSLETDPVIGASAKKTNASRPFNPAQRAWAFRAKQLSQAVRASEFSEAKFNAAVKKLKIIAAWPQEVRKVPSILAECGIRFVVIEPLPQTRIDGVAFWVGPSPVIAMSMRFDRIDNFWHVLGHEMSHIRHQDDPAVDADGEVDERAPGTIDEIEQRANRESAATWIDPKEMQSFIDRVGPLYSKDKINQFANRLRIHPGIIIGQLQHRGEVRYGAFKDSLVKVRNAVTVEAITDGWGHEINL